MSRCNAYRRCLGNYFPCVSPSENHSHIVAWVVNVVNPPDQVSGLIRAWARDLASSWCFVFVLEAQTPRLCTSHHASHFQPKSKYYLSLWPPSQFPLDRQIDSDRSLNRPSELSTTNKMPVGIQRINAKKTQPNDRIVFIKPLKGPDEAIAQDFLERIAAQCRMAPAPPLSPHSKLQKGSGNIG